MNIWKQARLTTADKELLAATQKEAEEQRVEARSLLSEAGRMASVLRDSRERNNYREALDEIFGGNPKRARRGRRRK